MFLLVVAMILLLLLPGLWLPVIMLLQLHNVGSDNIVVVVGVGGDNFVLVVAV